MATLGNQTTPTSGYKFIGAATAAASQFTMPSPGGTVTAISGYFDSETNGSSGYCCVWDNAGNLLVASSSFAINNKSGSGAGGQDWWTATISPAVYVPAGTIWIGFLATNSLVYSSESGGASNNLGMSSPGSFAGSSSSGIGAVGAYITYTPGGVAQVYGGPATGWVDGAGVKVWNGSSWVVCNPQVWNGSSWVSTS